jgi:hypothetical protein
MFIAEVMLTNNGTMTLGPTDTRDEASRLVRSWMERHPVAPGHPVPGRHSDAPVFKVTIKKIADEDAKT